MMEEQHINVSKSFSNDSQTTQKNWGSNQMCSRRALTPTPHRQCCHYGILCIVDRILLDRYTQVSAGSPSLVNDPDQTIGCY